MSVRAARLLVCSNLLSLSILKSLPEKKNMKLRINGCSENWFLRRGGETVVLIEEGTHTLQWSQEMSNFLQTSWDFFCMTQDLKLLYIYNSKVIETR